MLSGSAAQAVDGPGSRSTCRKELRWEQDRRTSPPLVRKHGGRETGLVR